MNTFTSDTVSSIKTPAQLIKELRIQHGLSQRELAYRAGTSQSAIARVERGDEDITWKRLSSILAAMGERPVLAGTRLPHRYELGDLMRDRACRPRLGWPTGFASTDSARRWLWQAQAKTRAKNARAA